MWKDENDDGWKDEDRQPWLQQAQRATERQEGSTDNTMAIAAFTGLTLLGINLLQGLVTSSLSQGTASSKLENHPMCGITTGGQVNIYSMPMPKH